MKTNAMLPLTLRMAVSASLVLFGVAPALQAGDTTRVSVDSAGVEGNGFSTAPSISASSNGRYVAFQSQASNLVPGDGNGLPDVFVHDRQTGLTTRVSVDSAGAEGNGGSFASSISAVGNGRYVGFSSDASNLVPGDGNGVGDCFVHDRGGPSGGVTNAVVGMTPR